MYGLTIPLTAVSLPDHAKLVADLPDLGYTDVWTSEVAGTDAFTPLALASAWSPTLRLGTAIAPVYTRGPALLAMTAAALAEAAPGRALVGLGSSSPVVVGQWNGLEFDRPYERSRDVFDFLRRALAGEVVDHAYETFTVRRFRLERPPAEPPRLFLAALRAKMLRLAAAAADGVILNWLAPGDVATVRAELTAARPGFEIAARIFVAPTDDVKVAREIGRRLITSYLTVPAYAAFHRWLGRGELLKPMWDAWAGGDRRGALAAVPDELVDDLVVHGSPEKCRHLVATYAEAGVTTPVVALLPTPSLDSSNLVSTLRVLGAQ
jgi:probable F420-dependent oxidoreductase